jgi:hypothetical protein
MKEYVKEKNELYKQYREKMMKTKSGSTLNMKEIQLNIKEKRKDMIEKIKEKRKEAREKYNRVYKIKY